eukprot:TRINITY_DN12421_c1_g2_i1.p1 TRINITY_DN12421_c1_g2~~TRINITY_DN12421_c1_g2_i1.p1  ORF type:complete len:250 (+),score=33.56 TRINITY_DN12421_c1_g2_i1:147-896(+)
MTSKYCGDDDAQLAGWTALRYIVLLVIVLYRVSMKMRATSMDGFLPHVQAFFRAGFEFASSEGVGMLIYFSVSAFMDNCAIFLDHSESEVVYCAYVKMVTLYTMALLTFLPTCWFSYKFQAAMYDDNTFAWRAAFVAIMVVITMTFFTLRILIVYKLGWAKLVDSFLTPCQFRVYIAILVPPTVDALQSIMLLLTARYASTYARSPSIDTDEFATTSGMGITDYVSGAQQDKRFLRVCQHEAPMMIASI